MKNTPVHRQEWILEELKREPLLSYGEMWAKYGLKWGKRKTTFNKDWKASQERLQTYQKKVQKEKEAVSIAVEKEAIKKGIKIYEIYEKYLNTKTRQGFALQRKAVERLRFYLEGKLAITYVDDKDEEYMNISKGDSDGIVNVIRDIEGVELAIFLREDKGNTKASVRSKNSIEYISSREFANIYGRRSDIKDLEDLE